MLADALDPPTTRMLLLVGVAVVAIGILLAVRFVTGLLAKLALVAVLVAVGMALWGERAELAGCAETGRCRVFGLDLDEES